MSETFRDFQKIMFIDNGGKPLDNDVRNFLHQVVYPSVIPKTWSDGEKKPVYTKMGLKLANSYDSIFYTDYHIYLKIAKEDIIKSSIKSISSAKTPDSYERYNSADGAIDEIVYQVRESGVASLDPNYYYVDVFDVSDGRKVEPTEAQTYNNTNGIIVCLPVSCKGYIDTSMAGTLISLELRTEVQSIYADKIDKEFAISLINTFEMTKESQVNGISTRIAIIFNDPITKINAKRMSVNWQNFAKTVQQICDNYSDRTVIVPKLVFENCNSQNESSPYDVLGMYLLGRNVVLEKADNASLLRGNSSTKSTDWNKNRGNSLMDNAELRPVSNGSYIEDRMVHNTKNVQNQGAKPLVQTENNKSERTVPKLFGRKEKNDIPVISNSQKADISQESQQPNLQPLLHNSQLNNQPSSSGVRLLSRNSEQQDFIGKEFESAVKAPAIEGLKTEPPILKMQSADSSANAGDFGLSKGVSNYPQDFSGMSGSKRLGAIIAAIGELDRASLAILTQVIKMRENELQ